ncbi:MAG: electron transfer flavoprotein-ubiquinone oxidoreductase [Gammaproteobacteria bacterium]|nr:electron transfer flavoprotein-ubiquinone oxidoreductase [Gammaproteobacteria bacterium]
MERESLAFDVVIVGAGPAGLSAAIRLAQLTLQDAAPLSICVLEKGAEVGSNIMSGAAIEPKALDELLPDWKALGAPLEVGITEDDIYLLTATHSLRLPTPKPMKNGGNYIISLENLCRWLAKQAENLGVTIFPGFAAVEIIYDADEKVCGVVTGDKGVDRNNQPTDRYQPGIKLLAKHTLFAEGCRGSLTKQLIKKFNLQDDRSPQTYGIGVKEFWKIPKEQHREGKVVHTVGWPLDSKTYGGSFIYHGANQQLAVGFIIGLDYQNPYLDPFEVLQQFKTHPKFIHLFKNGRRICYGARAITEGGWQSLPKLTVPGAMIIGDSAGTLNVPKIKGTHTAMKSGMIAAETLYAERHNLASELKEFEPNLRNSWVGKELYLARNIRPGFKKGLWTGLAYAALDNYIFHGRAPWTFKNHADFTTLKPAKAVKKIEYPKPDNKITFDKLSSVYLANTYYSENQPCHLEILNPLIPIEVNLKIYDSPESRYCPANVYEILHQDSVPYLQINASNCVHCKTCDIKDPKQNINWVPPEGGDGPNYIDM